MTDDFELIRLREALKWYWKHMGRLQADLQAEHAISDFWANEAERFMLLAQKTDGDLDVCLTDWPEELRLGEWHAKRGDR